MGLGGRRIEIQARQTLKEEKFAEHYSGMSRRDLARGLRKAAAASQDVLPSTDQVDFLRTILKNQIMIMAVMAEILEREP